MQNKVMDRAGEAWNIDGALIEAAISKKVAPEWDNRPHYRATLRKAVDSGLPLIEAQTGQPIDREKLAKLIGMLESTR